MQVHNHRIDLTDMANLQKNPHQKSAKRKRNPSKSEHAMRGEQRIRRAYSLRASNEGMAASYAFQAGSDFDDAGKREAAREAFNFGDELFASRKNPRKRNPRAPKGTPTPTNLFVLREVFADSDVADVLHPPTRVPHLNRCIDAGLIEVDRKARVLKITPAGKAAIGR